jgi:hypothetical protein
MDNYANKVALVADGRHVRYLPASAARAMVRDGYAVAGESTKGRIRSATLLRTADTHGERIGTPSTGYSNVRFHRWRKLDCGASVVEHHPRCLIVI